MRHLILIFNFILIVGKECSKKKRYSYLNINKNIIFKIKINILMKSGPTPLLIGTFKLDLAQMANTTLEGKLNFS